jgi:hypothetical protein
MLMVVAPVFQENVTPGVALAVNTAGLFIQESVRDDIAVIVGVVATAMLVVPVFTPQLLVPVTVYTVVDAGATVVLAVVAPLLHT